MAKFITFMEIIPNYRAQWIYAATYNILVFLTKCVLPHWWSWWMFIKVYVYNRKYSWYPIDSVHNFVENLHFEKHNSNMINLNENKLHSIRTIDEVSRYISKKTNST